MNKKSGLILINAYERTAADRTRRFAEVFFERGVNIDVSRNDFFAARILGGKLAHAPAYDFCLYLDKDKYAAAAIEKAGLRLFDRARTIELCDDKMLTHIALADSGIPMPDTLPGMLCYSPDEKIQENAADAVIDALGLPVIVKLSYGSLGSGVYKADTKIDLLRLMERVKLQPHLFQRYIGTSRGKDMRVIVIGGEVVGGIIRASDTDFRSNIGLGAHAVKADVPPDIRAYAIKAADILGADYCGIDFLLGETPMLCEVNSNAFFNAFEAATGIDVAGRYADHILKQP